MMVPCVVAALFMMLVVQFDFADPGELVLQAEAIAQPGYGTALRLEWADDDTLVIAGSAGLWIYDDLDSEPRLIGDPLRSWDRPVDANDNLIAVKSCFEYNEQDVCVNNAVTIWLLTSGTEYARFEQQWGEITDVDFSGDGTQLAFSTQNSLRVVDVQTLEFTQSSDTQYQLQRIALNYDGTRYGKLNEQGEMRAEWLDTVTGISGIIAENVRYDNFAFDNELTRAAFSPRFTADGEGKVIFRGVRLGEFDEIVIHTRITPMALDFSHDGRLLAIGTETGSIVLWDVLANKKIAQIETAFRGSILDIAFDPQGQRLAAIVRNGTTNDRMAKVWSISEE